ncbi:hypothetical protein ACIQHV_30340 [Bacillus bombysepticus]|nr:MULTISPECIES: hypothetical protein [Bacillus cereus group]MEC2867310.1 hypothetical protein [Bacillus cereus]
MSTVSGLNVRDKMLVKNILSIESFATIKQKNLCGIVYLINKQKG